MRRLHRGGEGQYLVNGAHVRRTDVVELLADVGLGGSMHSIISQGKVDAVLASKPADRRALVEEAAGLGKFKRRRHRAELKFARVATQVERARDVEAEVTKRLRPLALQATAAERAEKLGVEIAGLRAGIATLDVLALGAQIQEAASRRSGYTAERRAAEEALEGLLAERRRAGGAGRGGRRTRGCSFDALQAAERLRAARPPPGDRGVAADPRARAPPAVDAGLVERARVAEARATVLERAIAEREGCLRPPARSPRRVRPWRCPWQRSRRAVSARWRPPSAPRSSPRRRRRACACSRRRGSAASAT